MAFTPKQLYAKAFWWALIGSAVFVAIFFLITGIFHLFRSPGSAGAYVNGILYSSMMGELMGAGVVGWRVTEKYRHAKIDYWLKRYVQLSLLSLVVATGLIYTPLSGLVALWSLVAAAFVLRAQSDKPLLSLSFRNK